MFRKGKKRHSSSSSQSSEISTKSKSVDSSLGGLSRSSTVASLDTDSTKSSGQSNSNSDTCAEFRVKYVGAVEKLKHDESKTLEGPLDLINYIDVAQMVYIVHRFEEFSVNDVTEEAINSRVARCFQDEESLLLFSSICFSPLGWAGNGCNNLQLIPINQQDGKLPFVPAEEEFIMGVSKYGIKVTTLDQYDVLHRHALYLIVRLVCYDDGLGAGKSLLALKTTDANYEENSLWIYQCNNLEQAQAICKVLSTAFDSVLTSEKS